MDSFAPTGSATDVCVCLRVHNNNIIINLLEYYRYNDLVDDDGIDKAKALLAAARGNHLKAVECILMDDPIASDAITSSVLGVQLNGVMTWKIAVQDGLSCIFEV